MLLFTQHICGKTNGGRFYLLELQTHGIGEKLNISYSKVNVPAEDYDLWIKLSKIGTVANLPQVLLFYREHEGQITKLREIARIRNTNSISWNNFVGYMSEISNDKYVITSTNPTKVLLEKLRLLRKMRKINDLSRMTLDVINLHVKNIIQELHHDPIHFNKKSVTILIVNGFVLINEFSVRSFFGIFYRIGKYHMFRL